MSLARLANGVVRHTLQVSCAFATAAAASSGVISSYVLIVLPVAGLTDVIPILPPLTRVARGASRLFRTFRVRVQRRPGAIPAIGKDLELGCAGGRGAECFAVLFLGPTFHAPVLSLANLD